MLLSIRRQTTLCYLIVCLLVSTHLAVLAQSARTPIPGAGAAKVVHPPLVSASHQDTALAAYAYLSVALGLAEAPLVKTAPATASPARAARRELPDFTPYSEPILSVSPSDEELEAFPAFANRMVPATVRGEASRRGLSSRGENEAAAKAINRFADRTRSGDVSALDDFLREHPESRWAPSLRIASGQELFQTGRFSQAIEVWEKAWSAVPATDGNDNEVELREQAAYHLLEAYQRFQKRDELIALLDELEGAGHSGRISERVNTAREALWYWEMEPAESMLCGPLALLAINPSLPIPIADILEELENEETAEHGLPLNELERMANEHGWPSRAVFASGNYRIPVPSVVHLGLNHYSAIVAEVNGQYLFKDLTLDFHNWVSAEDIRSEASGYFLIPTESGRGTGYRSVPTSESAGVFGKCHMHAHSPNLTKACDMATSCGPGSSCGMPTAIIHLSAVSLGIVDTPIWYSTPFGPDFNFTVRYNLRETEQPTSMLFSNFGKLWTHDYHSYIEFNSLQQAPATVSLYLPGGGSETFQYNPTTNSYPRDSQSLAELKMISTSVFERRMPDGAQFVYSSVASGSNPRRVFLTEYIDSDGNSLSFTYDNNRRLIAITDAAGQVTTITNNGFRIQKVEDPFGRIATFGYSGARLVSITDMGGLQSTFEYNGSSDELASMTTPYGKSTFTIVSGTQKDGLYRSVEITDPIGDKERVEFKQPATAVLNVEIPSLTPSGPAVDPVRIYNHGLLYRNSFYWDKKAMRESPGDYNQARIYHWLNNTNYRSTGVLESYKDPSGSRIWFNYPGQIHPSIEGTGSQPSKIFRMVEAWNGASSPTTMQLTKFDYNALGNVTKSWDPMGRAFEYIYADNMIDLLQIHRVFSDSTPSELLMRAEYDENHRPTDIWGPSGHRDSAITYNGLGQVTHITDANNRTTEFRYFTSGTYEGYLDEIEDMETGATTKFLEYFRYLPSKVEDNEGYIVEYEYDDLDRVTKVTFPDESFVEYDYDRFDLVRVTDVAGRTTRMWYNDVGQLVLVRDPQGLRTQFSYCKCGDLKILIDPNGNITKWDYDVMGRLVRKSYQPADSVSEPLEIQYAYQPLSGLLASVLDSRNHRVNYQYGVDSSLGQVSYTPASGVGSLPAEVAIPRVQYTYDAEYGRLKTVNQLIADGGLGVTTYAYHPIPAVPAPEDPFTTADGAGMLASVDGPLTGASDLIEYEYDKLGRLVERTINGVENELSIVYDGSGRVTRVKNELDRFDFAYADTTSNLIASVTGYAEGFVTSFEYKDVEEDLLLESITNSITSMQTSKHEYDYDVNGLITQWTQRDGSSDPLRTLTFEYDASNRLTGAKRTIADSSDVRFWNYAYDAASNRTTEQILDVTGGGTPTRTSRSTLAAFNGLNQMTGRAGEGLHRATGTVPGLAKVEAWFGSNDAVTLAVSDPPGSSDKPFAGWVGIPGSVKLEGVPAGSTTLSIKAEDYVNPLLNDIENVSMTVVAEPDLSFTYDENGNTTSISEGTDTTQYTWDAADQLRRIVHPDGTSTEFKYDAMGRRVWQGEYDDEEELESSRYFVWDGLTIAEERNGADEEIVTRQYFAQGEIRGLTKYFYGRDHLGSVREVVDASTDTVVARYDYDPYGQREVVSEIVAFDWGFTGHYFHEASGLHLAPFRAYSAELGRWLSRDPLGEAGGINLYEYTLSNPVNFVDPLGLSVWDFIGGVADGLSFGLSTMALGSSINQCSTAFKAGSWAGFGGSLLLTGGAGGVGLVAARALMKGGAQQLVRNRARAVARFFYDSRDFKRQISREYWKSRGAANGRSLHHWAIPQRAAWVPQGIRNAGWNLVELPAMRGVFHRSLGLNQWMGFARNWGPTHARRAAAVENSIRIGIPSAAGGSAYVGYQLGR